MGTCRGVLFGLVWLLCAHAAQADECAWADPGLVDAPVVLTDAAGGVFHNPDDKLQSVLAELTFDGSDPRPGVRVQWLAGEPKGGGATPWLQALLGQLQNQRRVCADGAMPKAHFAQVFTYIGNPKDATLASQMKPVVSTPQLALAQPACLSRYQLRTALAYPEEARRKGIQGTVEVAFRVAPGSGSFETVWVKGPRVLAHHVQEFLAHQAPNCSTVETRTILYSLHFALKDDCARVVRAQVDSTVSDAKLARYREAHHCDQVFPAIEVGTRPADGTYELDELGRPGLEDIDWARVGGYEAYFFEDAYSQGLPGSIYELSSANDRPQDMVRWASEKFREALIRRPVADMKARLRAAAKASGHSAAAHGKEAAYTQANPSTSQ